MFSQESVLLTNGWQYIGKCTCSGTLQYKYRRGLDNIKVFIKKGYFTLNGMRYELSFLEEKAKSTEA